MSSYVTYQTHGVLIPTEHEEACLLAVNNLFTPEALEKHAKNHFGKTSYAPVETPSEPFKTLSKALENWMWKNEKTSEGILITKFLGVKWRHERTLLEAIAPYVSEGALIIQAAQGDMDIFIAAYEFSQGQIIQLEEIPAFRIMWGETGWRRYRPAETRSSFERYEESVDVEKVFSNSSEHRECTWAELPKYIEELKGGSLLPDDIDLMQRMLGRCTSMAVGFIKDKWFFVPSTFSFDDEWKDFKPCPDNVLFNK